MAGEIKTSILISLIDEITKPLKGVGEAFKTFKSGVEGARKASEGAFKMAADLNQASEAVNRFALRTRALLVGPIQAASGLQDALLEVEKRTGANAATMEQFRQAAIEMGTSGEFAASTVANVMAVSARAGESAANVMDRVKTASVLADAANMDLGQAVGMVTGLMRGYSIEAKDQASVQDLLTTAAQQSGGSVASIGAALSSIGPSMRLANVDIKQATVLLGHLGRAGVGPETAAMAVNDMATSLSGGGRRGLVTMKALAGLKINTKDSAGNMRNLGEILAELGTKTAKSKNQFFMLSKMFGPESAKSLLTIFKQGPAAMGQLNAAFEDTAGATQKLSDIQGRSYSEAAKDFEASTQTLRETLGTSLLPFLKQLTDGMTAIIREVVGWSNSHPTLSKVIMITVGAVALLATGLSGLLTVLATIASAVGIWAFTAAVRASGIALLSTALKAVPVFLSSLWAMGARLVLTASSFIFLKAQMIWLWITGLPGLAASMWTASVAANGLALPFLAVAVAVGAVSLAVAELVKNWKELDFMEGMKGITESFGENGILSTMTNLFDPSALFNDVKGTLGLETVNAAAASSTVPAGSTKLASPEIKNQTVNIEGGISIGLDAPLKKTGGKSAGLPIETFTNTGMALGY
jgi:TP901 family phage tail tape measure protein